MQSAKIESVLKHQSVLVLADFVLQDFVELRFTINRYGVYMVSSRGISNWNWS